MLGCKCRISVFLDPKEKIRGSKVRTIPGQKGSCWLGLQVGEQSQPQTTESVAKAGFLVWKNGWVDMKAGKIREVDEARSTSTICYCYSFFSYTINYYTETSIIYILCYIIFHIYIA